MSKITEKNARSASRPLIWITLAFHLALGGYLYLKTAPAPVVAVDTIEVAP